MTVTTLTNLAGQLRRLFCSVTGNVARLLLALFAAAALLSPLVTSAQEVVLDEIAIIVNDGIVLRSDISREFQFLQNTARANRQQLPDNEESREQVLQRLIDKEIQRQRAAAAGISIDASTVNRAIENIAAENNLNTFEFRERLQQQGFDFAYYRSTIEHELLLQRLVQREVESSITVTENEIDEYLESRELAEPEAVRYRLQHILIAAPADSSEPQREVARRQAQAVIERVNAGESFATVAREVSDGPRAANGGDLGWREAQELPGFIASVLPDLNQGDISEPIASESGFHVVQVQGIQSDGSEEPGEDVRIRHIFIQAAADTSRDARQILTAARERIVAGESFASLAKSISEDPDSKDNGGELPWINRAQLPQQMADIAASLPNGRVSQPFRSDFGWHILEVLERRESTGGNSRERAQATQVLRQQKFGREIENWSRRLRDEAFVEFRDGENANSTN